MGALYRHWQDKAGESGLPGREMFNPFELKPWLGHLMLLQVLDGGQDFFYRLFGVAVAELVGFDITGSRLSDLPDEGRNLLMQEYRLAVQSRRHIFSAGVPLYGRNYIIIDRLTLPLAGADGGVGFLLVAIYPSRGAADG